VRLAVQLALPLAALAQMQPFMLYQKEGPTGGPIRSITTFRSAIGSRAVYYIEPSSDSAIPSVYSLIRADLGKRFLISRQLKLISTYYLSPGEITALKNPKSSPVCDPGSGAKLVAQDHLFGILAFRYDSLLRGGAEQHSQWYAPALDCFPLQYEVRARESNGWKLTFSRMPTDLRLEAPRDVDFLVMSSYREVPPSEHQKAAIARKRGTPFGSHPNDAALQNTFERLDRHYHESQQFKPPQ
jgi:hypothetical protein